MIDFNKHTKLVFYVFEKNFKNYDYIKDDLCQEGLFALWKACSLFEKLKNVKFSTYAVRAIKNNMLCYIRKFEKKHQNNITFSELEEHVFDVDTILHITENYDFDYNKKLEKVLKDFSLRNQHIINDYLKNEPTQAELAKRFNLSRSSISKIITIFKRKYKGIYYES